MKQLNLLILFLALCLNFNVSAESTKPFDNLDKATEHKYWEFLKERLYDPEVQIFSSFQSKDINICLNRATSEDSLIVNNFIKLIQPLLPDRKIKLLDHLEFGTDISINLFFPYTKEVDEKVDNFKDAIRQKVVFDYSTNGALNEFCDTLGNEIKFDGFKGQYQPENYTQNLLFNFNKTVPFKLRKHYIEYTILRSMCNFNGKPQDIKTYVNGAIFNSYKFNPVGAEIKEVDKFLIHKLYAADFENQFRNYLISNSSRFSYFEPYLVSFLQSFSFDVIVYILILIAGIFLYKPIFIRKFKSRLLSYLIPAVTIGILFFIAIFISKMPMIIISYPLRYEHKLLNYVLHSFPRIIILFGVFSLLVYWIEQFVILKKREPSKQMVIKVFTIPVLLVLLLSVFGYLLIFTFNYKLHTASLLGALFLIGIIVSVARGILLYLRNLSELQLQTKESEISQLKEQKVKAELQSLHSRINPHFLYNSLNTIAGLAHNNPEKTEKMALALSDFFRYTINRNQTQISTLKEELEMAETYLEIEKIRFGERLTYHIEIEDVLLESLIPKFIIQPLVENAIKHGVSKMNGRGEISIVVYQIKDKIVLKVSDNGPAFEDGLVSGYGLQSVYDILNLSFGDSAEMNWTNTPQKEITVSYSIKLESDDSL